MKKLIKSIEETNCFEPIINNDSEILILGTMPGKTSLFTGQYYADSRNSFWKIIEELYNNNKEFTSYEEKIMCLSNAKIAIWDVFQACNREGSLDSNIKNPTLNNIRALLNQYPSIKKIIFNGKKASKQLIDTIPNVKIEVAPSSSNAFPISFKEKCTIWHECLKKN